MPSSVLFAFAFSIAVLFNPSLCNLIVRTSFQVQLEEDSRLSLAKHVTADKDI